MKAGTNQVLIENIHDGMEIDISALGTEKVSIRANVANINKVGSVRFALNGNNSYKMESQRPFSISGDLGGRFKPWPFEQGVENTLRATPFTGRGGTGAEGAYHEIRFTIRAAPVKPEVVSFSLIDALNNQVIIQEIQDNAVIDITNYNARAVNVRANTVGNAIGSVVFDLNGKSPYRIENVMPWALAGDMNGNYLVWHDTAAQQNTVKATPFSNMNGQGDAGTSKQIHFTLV